MKGFYKFTALAIALIIVSSMLCVIPSAAEEMTFLPTKVGTYIYGIPERTTFDELADVMPKTIIGIQTLDGTPVISGSIINIGTGFTITLNGNSYIAIVLGDVDGNGVINAIDYQMIKRHYIGTYEITGDARLLAAGDENLDGMIKAFKYLMVKRHVLGTYNINVNYTVPYTTPLDDESGWTTSWV